MENRAYALWVGAFTLLLGCLIVGAFWWFSSGGQNMSEYLVISPKSVTGLNPQAPVRFRGVRVGKVVDVDLQDSREVYVTIRIESDVPITRGTHAKIGLQGLTGQGFVQLDDDGSNPAPPVRLGKLPPIIAMQQGTLDQITDAGQVIVAKLKTSTERFEQLMSEENINRIDTTLKNLAASSEHLEKTLGPNGCAVCRHAPLHIPTECRTPGRHAGAIPDGEQATGSGSGGFPQGFGQGGCRRQPH